MTQHQTSEKSAELPFRSQFGEDRLLWEFFRYKRTGFYIDIGASNGTGLSNTYFFEQIGWTGLCIEPHPGCYMECLRTRPCSRVIHAALSRRGSSGLAPFTIVVGAADLSFLTTNAAHIARAKQEGKAFVQVPVPVTYMDALLENHSGPIDFVSLDVEGAELDVLDGFDLRKHRPTVFLIEDNSFGQDLRVEDTMARFGYRKGGRLGCNDIYIIAKGASS